MKAIIELNDPVEIKSPEELTKTMSRELNWSCSSEEIYYNENDIFNFLIKNDYKILMINILSNNVRDSYSHAGGEVTYGDRYTAKVNDIVALFPNEEIPTTDEDISKYKVINVFKRVLKEKILNL